MSWKITNELAQPYQRRYKVIFFKTTSWVSQNHNVEVTPKNGGNFIGFFKPTAIFQAARITERNTCTVCKVTNFKKKIATSRNKN